MTRRHRRSAAPTVAKRAFGLAVALSVAAGLAVVIPSGASAASTLLVNDSFNRTVSSGWGAVSSATYTVANGTRAGFSVGSGVGTISSLAPATSATVTLASVKATDVDLQATVTLPTTNSSLYIALELRRQTDGTSYRGRLQSSSSGNLSLSISRLAGGSETDLGRIPLPFTTAASKTISVQYRATGTNPVTIAGRAWVSGGSVPGWQNIVTDSSTARIGASGAVGLWEYAGSGNSGAVTTTFDNIVATADPAPAVTTGTPAPAPEPTTTTTPTPTPTPTTTASPAAPVATGSQGSATVGSTSYSAPSNALYVSVGSGNDSASGSQSAPLKTVAAAIDRASSGQTIVLRGGVYHESVTIPSKKVLTIQSYPKEAVWFDGSSRITSWTQSGSTWKTANWNYFPSSVMDSVTDNPRFVDANFPMAARPNQVFVNGTPLTQVSAASKVVAGTFYPDPSSKTITIGTDPNGKEVRASDLPQAIAVLQPGSVLQGFGVRKYAPNYDQRSAVRLGTTDLAVRNLTIEDTSMIGINATNNNISIDHVTVVRSGLLGVGVNASYGFSLTNSRLSNNNSEQFKAAPVSGGLKITRSRGVTIDNNNTSNNWGSGIWVDESCYDIRVTNNVSSNNQYTGIQLELSEKAIVADNDVSNQQFGMQIMNTGNVKIFNNSAGNNTKFNVRLYQDERRNANTAITGHDPRQPKPDSTVPWLTRNIVVSNNAFGTGGSFQVYAFDSKTRIPADSMNITIVGNLFNQRTTNAQATMVGWGGNDNSTVTRYDTIPQMLAKNSAWKNVSTNQALALSAMGSDIAAAASQAVPLPADVAAAIGQSSGSKKVGRY